jgi:hypothetical protein
MYLARSRTKRSRNSFQMKLTTATSRKTMKKPHYRKSYNPK